MQTDNARVLPTHSRSKLEFLYRELLIEVERLQHENRNLARELHQISITVSGAPQVLRNALAAAVDQTEQGAQQNLQLAAIALTQAQRDLRRTGQVLLSSSTRSAWYVGAIAGCCGLAGALLGVLVGAALLAG